MLKQFLTISLMLLGAFAWGQGFTVSGRVEDAKNHEAVPFTNVALLRTSDSVFMRGGTTDDKGVYTIRDVSAGDYLLKVAFAGYDTYWQAVSISGDTELPLISLTTSAVMLEGVVVTAERPLFSMDGEKMLYNTAEDPTVQAGTADDALRSAPDVEVDGEGNITLRGASGVEVWINGRPSHLEGESLKQYIKTLPASAIERIEVITNPSARYSTSSGVINIVTNQKVVLNDFLSIKLIGDSRPSFYPWITYVHSSEKLTFNLYASPTYRVEPTSVRSGYLLRDSMMNPAEWYNQDYYSHSSKVGIFGGGTLSYQINEKNSIQGWLNLWHQGDTVSSTNQVERLYYPGDTMKYSEIANGGNVYNNLFTGVQFTHQFDDEGHEFSLSASANMTQGDRYELFNRTFLTPGIDYQYDKRFPFINHNFALEADYTKPFGEKMELEAGLAYEPGLSVSDKTWDTLDFSTMLVSRDPWRSVSETFITHEFTAYATFLRRFGNLTAKVGLRAEDQYAIIRISGMEDLKPNYFNLVPSLHLSYRTAKRDYLSLSYSRRYGTPDGDQISPFRFYLLNSFNTGNPDLRCMYFHNLEAAWTRFIPKFGSLSLNAYYRANTDEIQYLNDVAFDSLVFHRYVRCNYPVNVGNSRTLGGTFSLTYRPNAMLNIRLDASVYDNWYRMTYRDSVYDAHLRLTYRLRLNAWVKVWNKVNLFCRASYTAPSDGLFTTNGDRKNIDLGASADLLNRKLSLSLSINDIFNWNAVHSTISNPYLTSWDTTRDLASRQITFLLTYRLGKMELEKIAKQSQ